MAKIFGNFISVTYEWKVYIRVGHFVNSKRDESKRTTVQERTKRRKKGEELEGKGQVLLEGRGTIGCYKCGVGDCLRAKACILIELCCKRVGWQPSFSSVSP